MFIGDIGNYVHKWRAFMYICVSIVIDVSKKKRLKKGLEINVDLHLSIALF